MTNDLSLQDVANYLDNIGIQFLATIGLDGKPKVRPMQYMILDDGKLWFCTNSEKDVYKELQRQIPDISQKSLTQTLRTLEEDGFVSREVFPEVPPRVEYSLTPRALSFLPLVENMINWAKENMEEINKDRTNNITL